MEMQRIAIADEKKFLTLVFCWFRFLLGIPRVGNLPTTKQTVSPHENHCSVLQVGEAFVPAVENSWATHSIKIHLLHGTC